MVDASALSAFLLREEGWRGLADYLAGAVWRAVRARVLTEEDGRWALGLLLRMVGRSLVLEPELGYLGRAFEISLAHGVTVCDALYIALALERDLPLLTLDEEQGRVAEALGVRVKP